VISSWSSCHDKNPFLINFGVLSLIGLTNFFRPPLFVGMVFPGFVGAEVLQNNKTDVNELAKTGRAEYSNLRMCLDYVADEMTNLDLKYNEVRVSPILMAEHSYEFPLEFSWLGTQNKLVPIIEKMLAYSFADTRLGHNSLSISVSAKMYNGQPLLNVTSKKKLMCRRNIANEQKDNIAEMWKSVSKRNQQITRAIRSLLKITTFTPQVGQKIEGNEIDKRKTWLTNLRLDSENHLQVVGYGLDPKQVTLLGKELFNSGSFVKVFLVSMTKINYKKTSVWRFEINAKIN
jgi:hypothetical protein